MSSIIFNCLYLIFDNRLLVAYILNCIRKCTGLLGSVTRHLLLRIFKVRSVSQCSVLVAQGYPWVWRQPCALQRASQRPRAAATLGQITLCTGSCRVREAARLHGSIRQDRRAWHHKGRVLCSGSQAGSTLWVRSAPRVCRGSTCMPLASPKFCLVNVLGTGKRESGERKSPFVHFAMHIFHTECLVPSLLLSMCPY